MRVTLRRLTVLIFTFTIGIFAAWSVGLFTKVEMLVAKVSPSFIFRAEMRGCGCGYVQGYSLLDGRSLSEGSAAAICSNTEDQFQSTLAKASKIVERIPKTNKYGDDGERVIILYYSDDLKEERAKILWHSKDGLTFIDAPTLEIAFTFEEVKAFR